MFAPSLLSGRLVQRLGAPGVMLGGAVLMLASVGVSLRGETFGHFSGRWPCWAWVGTAYMWGPAAC
ncbi:MAG: hypothetical protein U1E47_09780 [Rivihabitans pingtungensis]